MSPPLILLLAIAASIWAYVALVRRFLAARSRLFHELAETFGAVRVKEGTPGDPQFEIRFSREGFDLQVREETESGRGSRAHTELCLTPSGEGEGVAVVTCEPREPTSAPASLHAPSKRSALSQASSIRPVFVCHPRGSQEPGAIAGAEAFATGDASFDERYCIWTFEGKALRGFLTGERLRQVASFGEKLRLHGFRLHLDDKGALRLRLPARVADSKTLRAFVEEGLALAHLFLKASGANDDAGAPEAEGV